MKGVVVSDASPLHYLILIDAAELLPRLFSEVLVPNAVIAELSAEQTPGVVSRWVAQPPEWIKIASPLHAPDVFGLDTGETQAIWLGEEYGVKSILMDERKGRRIAAERGFLVAGTLALIERFARLGWIDFEYTLARLQTTTFRLNDQLIFDMRRRLSSFNP